jgi:heme-degrading monooxygenase HmoA
MCRSRSSVAHIETFIMGLMRDAEYIRETGFAEYGQTPGNRGAWMLRRDEGERTEFITLSLWESEDAIRSFAGDDIEAAVLYPEDARYLIGDRS